MREVGIDLSGAQPQLLTEELFRERVIAHHHALRREVLPTSPALVATLAAT